MKKILAALPSLLLCATLLSAPQAGNAAILQVNGGGILTGALGVNVGGVVYDVTFQDGTCASVFGTCTQSSFAFSSAQDALAAQQALMDQVFIDGAAGAFDSTPKLTYGCEFEFSCWFFTPYAIAGDTLSLAVVVNQNTTGDGGGFTMTQNASSWSTITPGFADNYSWAVWSSRVADVPEPETLSLVAAAVFAAAALRRRRTRS